MNKNFILGLALIISGAIMISAAAICIALVSMSELSILLLIFAIINFVGGLILFRTDKSK